jgi:PadR family transcriptional regulator, regulatory protein AphA
MSIEYAILGLLVHQPMSGYDLKKIISRSNTFYWSGNNNQIYNELVSLYRDGFLSQEIIFQENKPPRKIYAITEIGKQKLVGWLGSKPLPPERKHPFLIQLAWADMLSDSEVDELLAGYEEEITTQCIMAEQQENSTMANRISTSRQAFFWAQIQKNWIGYYRAELEWVQSLRKELLEQAG